MINSLHTAKLVHVLRNDALGGVEQSTLEVARYFSLQGIQQQVIILSPLSGGISEHFKDEKISVISIPFTKTNFIPFILAYWACLRKFRPEVQLVSGAYGLHALLAIIARAAGVERCWTYLIMGPADHGLPYFTQYLMGQIARIFSVGEIAVSEHLKEMFIKLIFLPRSRINVIHRWRDIDNIYHLANAARNDKKSLLPIVLSIGRLDWTKDFENLINAFSFFIRNEPGSLFYIVGDGHLRMQLEEQVKDLDLTNSIIFLGHRNDIAAMLGDSNIFLFSTSPTEGIGNVMIEAMAAGTPMICTDVGPCREVTGDGVGGILVPPGDPKSLAQAMLTLWRDPIKRQKLAVQAHEFSRKRYTKEICGQQLMNLLFPARKPPQVL